VRYALPVLFARVRKFLWLGSLAWPCLTSLWLSGCAGESTTTHVFVRDPHQVWVEASSKNGEEVVLPPGTGLRSVRILEGDAARPGLGGVVSTATLFREPSGSITVDDRLCAPWPLSPLTSRGELHIEQSSGQAPFVSDGATVRVAYVCTGPNHTKAEIDFVTPWANVREVRVVRGEETTVAPSSTHPALQRADWRDSPTY